MIMSLFFSLSSLSHFSPSSPPYISHPNHFPSTLSLISPFLSFPSRYLPYPLSFPVLLVIFPLSCSPCVPALSCSYFAVPTACFLALFRHGGPGIPVALCPRYVTVSLFHYLIPSSLLLISLFFFFSCTMKDQETENRERDVRLPVGLQEEGLWILSGKGN